MHTDQGPSRHEKVLSEINSRDGDALRRLTYRMEHQPEVGVALARFRAGLLLGAPDQPFADGLIPAGFELDPSAAKTFVEVLTTHPAFAENRRLGFGLNILGESDSDPSIAGVRSDAAELLISGALAFGALGMSETLIEPLMHVALGP